MERVPQCSRFIEEEMRLPYAMATCYLEKDCHAIVFYTNDFISDMLQPTKKIWVEIHFGPCDGFV
eukprot:UN14755